MSGDELIWQDVQNEILNTQLKAGELKLLTMQQIQNASTKPEQSTLGMILGDNRAALEDAVLSVVLKGAEDFNPEDWKLLESGQHSMQVRHIRTKIDVKLTRNQLSIFSTLGFNKQFTSKDELAMNPVFNAAKYIMYHKYRAEVEALVDKINSGGEVEEESKQEEYTFGSISAEEVYDPAKAL